MENTESKIWKTRSLNLKYGEVENRKYDVENNYNLCITMHNLARRKQILANVTNKVSLKFRLNMDYFHIKSAHIVQLILLIVSLYLFCQFKLIYRA